MRSQPLQQSRSQLAWRVAALCLIAGLSGCDNGPADPYAGYEFGPVFNDFAQSNQEVAAENVPLTFLDTAGAPVELSQYRGQKYVVLVFTRGFSQSLCAFCVAQTSRLVSNIAEFEERNAQVLLVFPGSKQHVGDFLHRVGEDLEEEDLSALPFPVLLDEEFAAVRQLGIEGDLAKPSTYILDLSGKVRFAYVGQHIGDRPSVQALLKQLDALNAEDDASPAAAQ